MHTPNWPLQAEPSDEFDVPTAAKPEDTLNDTKLSDKVVEKSEERENKPVQGHQDGEFAGTDSDSDDETPLPKIHKREQPKIEATTSEAPEEEIKAEEPKEETKPAVKSSPFDFAFEEPIRRPSPSPVTPTKTEPEPSPEVTGI